MKQKKWLVIIGLWLLFEALTSRIMNIPEVTVHYECIQKVVNHFEAGVKNKEVLVGAMEILEVKPLHLVSWYKARLKHFLKAEAVFDDMLPAVYDVMFTQNMKPDERDVIFTTKN